MTFSVGRGDLLRYLLDLDRAPDQHGHGPKRPLPGDASSPIAETLSVPTPTAPVRPQVFEVEMPRTRGRWGRHSSTASIGLVATLIERLSDAILQRAQDILIATMNFDRQVASNCC